MPEPTSLQPRPESHQATTFRLPKHPRNVPDARAQVRKALADWGLPTELATDVALVATEFVSNSVRHCEVTFALIEVTLTLQSDQLLLEVSDPDKERLPAPRAAGQQDEDGRGLAVIAALTSQWGCDLRRFTKCSWATFPLPEVAPACSG
ncbi:ATP-binding protein [Streptomyces sp. NBC_00576]|uniref:ATP-binding protein n=1 Tax=Streptomyces sp. NBC_00576 TaxID=2903665 RepID=UPI002E8126DA|nr:ATP-binding protein [Streptomyces sp. NBC_00576]WUB73222.1 ATP-binding protein [Streptomyces sp. NBC_00576]